MYLTTTLNAIRAKGPCEDGWEKLLKSLNKTKADDEELSLEHILESNGVADAIWCLRAVEGYDREKRLFACDCAEHVLHLYEEKYPDDDRPRKAIEVSRRYADGEATSDELVAAAADAAWAARAAWVAADAAAARAVDAAAADAAARAAAWHAARAAAWAAAAAAWAAAAAADAARAVDNAACTIIRKHLPWGSF